MKNRFGLKIGLVIIGYKNTEGIRRLLKSLDQVDFGKDETLLIFSIDYSKDDSVSKLVQDYKWFHGDKIVKLHEKNLGLKSHIMKCGSYIEEYGLDALIVLEDDIYLSRNMYNYALMSIERYKNDDYIAGISLYKHEFNINAKHPFFDYIDGYDVFFMQYAQSWGQIWFKDKWADFMEWYTHNEWENLDSDLVPDNVKAWKNSWLKYHIMYCIDKNKYFVYPRYSLTTNFSDAGVHGSRQSVDMQVSLDNSYSNDWNFPNISESYSIYDAFFQNTRLAKICEVNDLEIDLYGVKNAHSKCRYLLSVKKFNYRVVRSWGLQLRPIEANVFQDVEGEEIFLYDTYETNKNIKSGYWKMKLYEYDLKGIRTCSIQGMVYNILFVYRYIKNKIVQFSKRVK